MFYSYGSEKKNRTVHLNTSELPKWHYFWSGSFRQKKLTTCCTTRVCVQRYPSVSFDSLFCSTPFLDWQLFVRGRLCHLIMESRSLWDTGGGVCYGWCSFQQIEGADIKWFVKCCVYFFLFCLVDVRWNFWLSRIYLFLHNTIVMATKWQQWCFCAVFLNKCVATHKCATRIPLMCRGQSRLGSKISRIPK